MKKIIILITIFACIAFISQKSYDPNISIEETKEVSDVLTQDETSKPIFTFQAIPENIYQNMTGKSIPLIYQNSVDINSLSYLQITHIGFDEKTHLGEMIVHKELASDVLEIFEELYNINYPIEKIKLIDEYDANDELSMSDNNTSCFCYRVIAGTTSISNHAKRNCN